MSAWFYLAFVLTVQLGAIIWWASGIGARLKQVEKDQDKMAMEVNAINKLEVRMSVVESILDRQTDVLRQIRDNQLTGRGNL